MFKEFFMVALIIGILFIALALFSLLPSPYGLAWLGDVLLFLRGAAPVIAAFLGLIISFIGIADIKDRQDAKKEIKEAEKKEKP
jgi:amino acid transporter